MMLSSESAKAYDGTGPSFNPIRLLKTSWLTFLLNVKYLCSKINSSFRFYQYEEEEEFPIHLSRSALAVQARATCSGQETCRSGELGFLKPSQLLNFIRSLELEDLFRTALLGA